MKNATQTLRVGNGAVSVPKVYAATTVTTSTGSVSFTIPSGYFTTLAFVSLIVVRDTTSPTQATFAAVRTRTTTSVIGQVWESKTSAVIVLNTTVEGLEPSAAGITVDLIAIGT